MKRLLVLLLSLFVLVLSLNGSTAPAAAQPSAITVIATNTILADVARVVAADLINVDSLLPTDADPHAYQPTVEDAARLANAQMILADGAGYEQFLTNLIQSTGSNIPVVLASRNVQILRVSSHDPNSGAWEPEALGTLGDGLTCAGDPPLTSSTDATAEAAAPSAECDPHVWMNPLNVIMWAQNIADAFTTLDPDHEQVFRQYAADYAAQLEALDLEIQQTIAEVPPERRVLVTTHEFMAYFADQYGFQIAGTVLPGASSAAESDPQRLADLIAFLRDQHVPAVFAEVSANPEMAHLVASEAGVTLVTTLYSESLSAYDGDAPTYIDLMRTNARTIANALR
ncbi:MAG: zinc ABC transporter substrate-binding protein [Anaerolineae bacterium]